MKLLTVDTLETARQKVLDAAKGWNVGTEIMETEDASGRVLAENVVSTAPIPNFRRSTVDGYAVCSKDTQGASESLPVFLEIVEEVLMGKHSTRTLVNGQCAYVPTGGMIPEGADAMVMVEYCELFDENNVAVYSAVSPGKNMIGIGEDIQAGVEFLKRGTSLRPQEIGALASAGVSKVRVYKPMRLTLISTGDELVSIDCPLNMGQIHDVNTYAIKSQAVKHGIDVVQIHVLEDKEQLLRETVIDAMQYSDMIAISGGSSQGKKDVTAKIIGEVGFPGVLTHGIALKPGKPTISGYDEKTQTILLGLPGHPVAALMVFELLGIWVLEQLTGKKPNKQITAKMETNIASAPGRATCQLVELLESEDGYVARPVFGKSGLMTTLTKADGYTMIEVNKEGLQAGEVVRVQLI